jgi:hypothetical protein
MKFDPEGHLNYSPAEVLAFAKRDASRLINDVLWRATPKMFDTYEAYRDFVAFVARELDVHPSCILFRGSTRLGFSMTPKSGKISRFASEVVGAWAAQTRRSESRMYREICIS